MRGHFDLCDGIVSLSLSDFSTGLQAPPIFRATYSSESKTIRIAVDTDDRSYIGNHKLVLSFTAPATKSLPADTYLIDVTIVDPCDADIWRDSDFGKI